MPSSFRKQARRDLRQRDPARILSILTVPAEGHRGDFSG